MNVEELRSYCLSLSPNVEEKFPFPKFKAARDVLAFYIDGICSATSISMT